MKGTLEDAIVLAIKVHRGQLDKGGEPYILHCLRVMMSVEPHLRVPAVLHDVVEDGGNSELEVISDIFGADIAFIVGTLTRRKDEDYFDYIRRIMTSAAAVHIKVADLKQNLDMERLMKAMDNGYDMGRSIIRYNHALRMLYERTR